MHKLFVRNISVEAILKCIQTHPHLPAAHPGQTELHLDLVKKVEIFSFATKMVELVVFNDMTVSAYKSKCSFQRSSSAQRRARNVSA